MPPKSESSTPSREGKVAEATPVTTALRTSLAAASEQSADDGAGDNGVKGPHPAGSSSHGKTSPAPNDPAYTLEQLDSVKDIVRPPQTFGDKAVRAFVKVLRTTFDFFNRYNPEFVSPSVLQSTTVEKLRQEGRILTERQWLFRIILLESIAGVPGMVAGVVRHLKSLRALRNDGGWIHTLLEEAENERMHLLTFLTIRQPGFFLRALVLAGQGVAGTFFLLLYLLSSKSAHRLVAVLEEEAVNTYTHVVHDVESGLVPEWSDLRAPTIAIDYWRLPPDARMIDVLKAVRADEATHRFVNHTFADLDQNKDVNPFAVAEPSAEIRGTKSGFTRDESLEFVQAVEKQLGEDKGGKGKDEEELEKPKQQTFEGGKV